jgi:hypothetical protein
VRNGNGLHLSGDLAEKDGNWLLAAFQHFLYSRAEFPQDIHIMRYHATGTLIENKI